MTRATEYVQKYRLALRDIWNYHMRFLFPVDGDSVRDFESLKLPLFRALVARQLEPLGEPEDRIFGNSFKVVPALNSGPLRSIQPLGAEDQPARGVVTGPFGSGELSLVLVDFFDWDELGWRDLHYYRVRVDRCNGHTSLEGREALVPVAEADVIFNAVP